MTQKIIWSPQHEARLVDLVKEADHVWNNTNTDFFNARLRNTSFQDIAAKLGGDFTTKSVQERWTSIKSTYRNNLRKVEVTKKTAQSPDDVYHPTWHLWDQCQFMAGLEFKAIKRKLERTQIPIENVKIEYDNQDSDFGDPISSKKASTSGSMKKRLSKRIDKSECERLLEEARGVLKLLENDERLHPTEATKFSHISKHVAERLSKMRPYDAECATKKIMDVLSLYSEFNPENPNRNEY